MYELEEIARLFLAAESETAIVNSVMTALRSLSSKPKPKPKWLPRLAKSYFEAFRTRPRQRDVMAFLSNDGGFRRALWRIELPVAMRIDPPEMRPVGSWQVPSLTTPAELAEWLGLTEAELSWFADLGAFQTSAKLSHYRYHTVPKKDGVRIVEAPKSRMKAIQRKILTQILDAVPGHPAAHGFVQGRSIRTFATPHAGQDILLRMDLENFFPSISGVRVQALFRVFGYPEAVADLLGGVCTNAVPFAFARLCEFDERRMYSQPHLPQGAPTSPALANRIAYRLDCRLRGLAESCGGVYTRYADDLAFSGGLDFARGIERFAAQVAAVVLEEGFAVNFRKTRVMRRGCRQHLAGLVTNAGVNVPREEFETLKAILTNCIRKGPESQNRAAVPCFKEHLAGRIAFVSSVNPTRGARLRELFFRIPWGD
jgi:RNA-directed DNA polymerase